MRYFGDAFAANAALLLVQSIRVRVGVKLFPIYLYVNISQHVKLYQKQELERARENESELERARENESELERARASQRERERARESESEPERARAS